MNNADIGWMLVSTALVLLMTPALGFFYGGMVRAKNALNTMMMSFVVAGARWRCCGRWPATRWPSRRARRWSAGWPSWGCAASASRRRAPFLTCLFMAFQGTFAIITAALISGAIVERMRFGAYLAFIMAWMVVVYAPVAHWVWGGGFLADGRRARLRRRRRRPRERGVGGAGGGAGRRSAQGLLRARRFCRTTCRSRCSAPACCGLAGSASTRAARSGATPIAALAFVNTMLAPAATLAVWTLLDLMRGGRATAIGAATAIVVGLVVVTPAAGYIGPASALALGAIGAFPSYFALIYRARTKLDDSLDVVAAHGVGGATGAILTGVFADAAWSGGPSGLLVGQSRAGADPGLQRGSPCWPTAASRRSSSSR